MYKKFLVPVDGSHTSRLAYEKAVELAKLTNAEIVLLQVSYDIDYYARKGVLFARKYYNESETKGASAAIISGIRKDVDEGDLKITELILLGDPSQKIIDESIKGSYDLIVMGSRGIGAFKGAVLGSVSQHVLVGTNRPILIVKDPHEA